MIARKYGSDQFLRWRRGYKERPPEVNSFSPYYPGNEKRYVRFMHDVRYSVSETLIRSIGNRRLTLARKFPKTESLSDCMKRTIPYLVNHVGIPVRDGRPRCGSGRVLRFYIPRHTLKQTHSLLGMSKHFRSCACTLTALSCTLSVHTYRYNRKQ